MVVDPLPTPPPLAPNVLLAETVEQIERDGFAVVPGVLSAAEIATLRAALDRVPWDAFVQRRGSAYALRDVLRLFPDARELARSPGVRALVEEVLGSGAFAVRGLLFDKTVGANWTVAWHQDLTIAVRERREMDGFRAWSVKAGVAHVQPPAAVLERMLAVRIHLDDCGPENGPLRVLPGSHRAGRLSDARIRELGSAGGEVTCCIPAGGVLLMRPLLVHASSPAERPGHRRVLHLEFAAEELPGGLEWHERIAPGS